jgi:hypothetical protein
MKNLGCQSGWTGFGLLAGLWLVTSGCQTYSGPPEKNLALVTITNRPPADVQAAIIKVFHAHSFTGGSTGNNSFNFTRKGGAMDKMIYGSYLFTDTVTLKVTVMTHRLPDGTIGVGCDAWMDEGEDDPVFEGDHQLTPLRKGPYLALLREVKKNLGE